MPEKHPKPCVSLLLPLNASPSVSDSSQPGAPLPAEVPRRLHSQKRGFSWGPQHQRTWRRVTFPGSSRPEVQATIACTRLYGSSHGKADSTGLRGAPFRAPARLPTPLQPSHVTEAWSGSREWKAAQGRENQRE